MNRAVLITAATLLAGAAPLSLSAQSPPPAEAFWTVSYYEIDWPKMDSLTKLFKAYTLPAAAEAKKGGVLLDYKILIHRWAGRENLIVMQKFSNFAAIGSDTSFIAALNRMVPDSTKRQAVIGAFRAIFGANLHRDEIFTEVSRE